MVEIVSTPVEFRMQRNLDGEIEVAVRTAARSASSFARDSQHLLICDTGVNRYLDRLTIDLDEARRAVIGFFKREGCPSCKILAFDCNASSASCLTAVLSKEHLKEIVDASVAIRRIGCVRTRPARLPAAAACVLRPIKSPRLCPGFFVMFPI